MQKLEWFDDSLSGYLEVLLIYEEIGDDEWRDLSVMGAAYTYQLKDDRESMKKILNKYPWVLERIKQGQR